MWFRILVLSLGAFAVGTDGFVIAGILPNIAGGLGISLALAGLAITTFSLIYGLGAPVLAALMGRLERRRLLMVSLLVLTVANGLAGLTSNFPLLLAARILAALGASLYMPTAAAVVAGLAPVETRGRALSLVSTGLTASTILGVPVGILISSWLNWQATMFFVALLSLLALVGILLLFPRVSAPPVVSLRNRLKFLRQPALLLTLLQTVMVLSGYQIIATYLRPFLQNVTHIDDVTVSVVLLLFGIAGLIGGLLGGYGSDRWGSVRTLVGGLAVLCIVLFLFPWASLTLVGAIVGLVVWGISGWAIPPIQQYRLIALAPSSANIVLSLNSSAIYLGISLGSALGSLLIQSVSLSMLCWIAAAWMVVTLFVVLFSLYRVQGSSELMTQEEAVDYVPVTHLLEG